MTTLADLTPEQRQKCVGMWAETPIGKLLVIRSIEEGIDATHIRTITPSTGAFTHWTRPEDLTPRYDLPRAWQPDGTPPKGEWEYYLVSLNDGDIKFSTYSSSIEHTKKMKEWQTAKGNTARIRRRWHGEWEEQ